MKFIALSTKMVNREKIVWVDFFGFAQPYAILHMDNGDEVKVYGEQETISRKLNKLVVYK